MPVQLVRELGAAICQQRAQASRALLVPLNSHALAYSAALAERMGRALQTLDLPAEDGRCLPSELQSIHAMRMR